MDTGTQSDRVGTLGTGTLDIDISVDGFFVAGLAKWPLGEVLAPYAKFGAFSYDARQTVLSGSDSFSVSASDTDFLYGVGCEFKLGDKFQLRAEYEEVNMPRSAFDIFSVVATYQF